ncbi:MAG: 2OG-Fe(II) oxygenase, partial [Pseudomonadales bacterium]|nr:2OG-Fe(II) oxygenase [Pseudomonadales bacterium]
YLNENWSIASGGELRFLGEGESTVSIAPLFNRSVLFDPSSKGSEHWVEKLKDEGVFTYRYNVTSWYWTF